MKDANCKGINTYFIDLDQKNGSPEEHLERIKSAALKPEIVIKSSKVGHHVYWFAKDGVLEKFDDVIDGIVDVLNGDTNAKGKTRRMRIPFFLNQKPEHGESFMPQIVEGFGYIINSERPPGYNEEEMIMAFPKPKKKQEVSKEEAGIIRVKMGFWDAAASVGNKVALKVLSGKPEVRNEVFSFKRNTNGTEQIIVNGESTSCWIDQEGYIGSRDKGGPTYIQWLEWYGMSKNEVAKTIKKYLREHLPDYKDDNAGKDYTFITWHDLVERAYQRKIAIDPDKICKFHIKCLDEVLGGILPTDLVTIGADTGCGKSDLLLYIAMKNAEMGMRVLYYQLEMDEEEIADRQMLTATNLILGKAWISPKDYRINSMMPDQRRAFDSAKDEVKKMGGGGGNIVIYEGAALKFDEFLESMNITKRTPFDLVVLDHLHYFSMDGGTESMSQNLARIMRRIRSMVKKYRVPVVVASHIRKLQKENERPRLIDLYGAGDIAKESTVVLMLHRDGDDTFAYIDKSRGTGHRDCEIKLHYDINLRTFVDEPKTEHPAPTLTFLKNA